MNRKTKYYKELFEREAERSEKLHKDITEKVDENDILNSRLNTANARIAQLEAEKEAEPVE